MYFVRQQTRISGPFPADQIRAMLRRGRVARSDKVSTDRETWQVISDCPEIVEPPAAAPADEPAAAAPVADDYKWFYTSRGVQQPESTDTATLQGLVASGVVGPADVVWRDGFPDWVAVSAVAELTAAAPPTDPGLDLGLPPIVDDRFNF